MTCQVILAIDGGATKTETTLRTEEGVILFHDIRSGTNYRTIGLAALRTVFESVIISLCEKYPEKRIDIAVLGLAGIDSEEDKRKVYQLASDLFQMNEMKVGRLVVENDVVSVMRGALKEEAGVILVAGTGSIAYGQNGNGDIQRVGGWGNIAGDEGSGYWIGREIMRAICRMEDGRGHSTFLQEAAFQLAGCRTVDELVQLRTVHEVAQLAAVLENCCMQGDSAAIRIAEQAAEELACVAITCVRACGLEWQNSKIRVGGGVLTHSFHVFRKLKESLQKEFPACRLELLPKRPIEYVVERGIAFVKIDG